jgi:hypothetical protein
MLSERMTGVMDLSDDGWRRSNVPQSEDWTVKGQLSIALTFGKETNCSLKQDDVLRAV